MRTWRAMLNAALERLGLSRQIEPMNGDSALAVIDEIEAILDLTLYSAAQAVAHAKNVEREIDHLQQQSSWDAEESAQFQRLSEECSAVQIEVQNLRMRLDQLHRDLSAARRRLIRADSRMALDDSTRFLSEVANSRDWKESGEILDATND